MPTSSATRRVDLVHFFLRGAAVFQRKGDIFRHRQADELAVRILQHGADMIRQLKNAAVGRIHAVYCQAACTLTGVGEGIQAIDAGCQCAFAAAGRPGNQDALTRVDIQVDIMQGGLLLGAVLERKIFEGYDGCLWSLPYGTSQGNSCCNSKMPSRVRGKAYGGQT